MLKNILKCKCQTGDSKSLNSYTHVESALTPAGSITGWMHGLLQANGKDCKTILSYNTTQQPTTCFNTLLMLIFILKIFTSTMFNPTCLHKIRSVQIGSNKWKVGNFLDFTNQ